MVLAAALGGAQKFAVRKPADEFIGAWKLVSYEHRSAAGEISYPMGQHPVGRIAYDPLGRMSAQLMPADRPNFKGSPGTSEERAAAFDTYVAYYGTYMALIRHLYGTYTVNPADHQVVHHVEASLFPNWAGTDLTRSYEFSGSQLILRAAWQQGAELRLVWERAR
jgi:hypothetical protein